MSDPRAPEWRDLPEPSKTVSDIECNCGAETARQTAESLRQLLIDTEPVMYEIATGVRKVGASDEAIEASGVPRAVLPMQRVWNVAVTLISTCEARFGHFSWCNQAQQYQYTIDAKGSRA